MVDAGDELTDWLQALPPILDRLAWFVPADFHADYSTDSLDVLEATLAAQVVPTATGDLPPDTGLIESACAYLGQALLRVAGGGWDWDAAPTSPTRGLPILRFDAALGLPAVAPLRLLIEARKAGTGTELRKVHERLQQSVAEYQSSHPGWTPAQSGEEAIDPATRPPAPELTEWLAEREKAFAPWAEAAGDGPWDYRAESVARLTHLTLSRFPDVEAFNAPANAEFVAGATWYLGETVRRTAPGVYWQYQPVPDGYADAHDYYAQTGDAWVGAPYLLQYPNDAMTDPRSLLKIAVIRREPDVVREGLADFYR